MGRPIPTQPQFVDRSVSIKHNAIFSTSIGPLDDEQWLLKVRVVWRKTLTLLDKLQFNRSPHRMHRFSQNLERICPRPRHLCVPNLAPFCSLRRVLCFIDLVICSFSNFTFQHIFSRRIPAYRVPADFFTDSESPISGLSNECNFCKIELWEIFSFPPKENARFSKLHLSTLLPAVELQPPKWWRISLQILNCQTQGYPTSVLSAKSNCGRRFFIPTQRKRALFKLHFSTHFQP